MHAEVCTDTHRGQKISEGVALLVALIFIVISFILRGNHKLVTIG